MTAAVDFARRCDPPVYLSNAEKEALQLTGYGDPPTWAVVQALEQAVAKGTYIPGEEALRLRLTDALDLEERLALQQAEELQESADVAIGDLAFAAAYNEMASHVAEGFQQGLAEGVEASPDVDLPEFDPAEKLAWSEGAHVPSLATEGQEAAEEPPTDQWRSPLEIVTEGAEEAEQEATGEEDAEPAAAAQRIEDRDFSSFTKAQLLAFAQDHFGAKLSRADSKDDLIGQVQGLVDEANEKTV